MEKLKLPSVTIVGIDCVNVERLIAAMDVSEKNIAFGESLILTSLPTNDSRARQIPHLDSVEAYSIFCIKELHTYIKTDYVLLIQYDGFVLDATKWKDEFLKYDYIGGPISTKNWKDKKEGTPELIMGNGGFSLRSKKLLDLCGKFAIDGTMERLHPEDTAICVDYRDLLEKEGIHFAPLGIAIDFSVQYDYGIPYERPFGFHGMYDKNLEIIAEEHREFPLLFFMPRIRRGRVLRIKDSFEDSALLGYTFDYTTDALTDTYSSINFFLIIPDEKFEEVSQNRIKYYKSVGYNANEIIHIAELPSNPLGDPIQSLVLYKTKVGLLGVTFILYPKSKSFLPEKYKLIFGETEGFPTGETPSPISIQNVSDDVLLDFFIISLFNAVRAVARKSQNDIADFLHDYTYLATKYPLQRMLDTLLTFELLKEIIVELQNHGTQKQVNTLVEISVFIDQVEKFISYSSQ